MVDSEVGMAYSLGFEGPRLEWDLEADEDDDAPKWRLDHIHNLHKD